MQLILALGKNILRVGKSIAIDFQGRERVRYFGSTRRGQGAFGRGPAPRTEEMNCRRL